ncbi:hypothetical protein [Cellulomonas sp. P5_C6]
MKRWVAAALAAVVALALSACDPAMPSGETNGAELDVVVNADGSGTAELYLDDTTVRSDAQLRAWGDEVGARLFPSASSRTVRVDPNGGGYPFVVVDAQDLYRPGPQPQVSLDTRDAVTWLLADGPDGVDVVDVSIDSPRVPLTSSWTPSRGEDESTWAWWGITDGTTAPYGELVMSPAPWLGVMAVLLTGLGLALLVWSVVTYVRRRRRARAMILAAGALAVSVLVVLRAGAVLPNNLGVAGVASDTWVQAASLATLAVVLVAPASFVMLVVYAATPRRRPVFAAPPGWPPPPPGWTPPPGWEPDPSWPPAPEGWQFSRDAGERPRA